MATLWQRIRGRSSRAAVDPLAPYAVNPYLVGPAGPTMGREETYTGEFVAAVQHAYRSNGIIFACNLARASVFAEARFQFRRLQDGRPGDLFGTRELGVVESPWPGGTTADLLTRMIQDVDLGGNAFIYRAPNGRLKRLRPDYVTIVLGSRSEPELFGDALDAELLGYIYHPQGSGQLDDGVVLLPDEVAHWAPIPDPLFHYRGMSWVTPIARELAADDAATNHKLSYFRNGATSGVIVSLDSSVTEEKAKRFIELFRQQHEGVTNAYRTVFLGGGAQVHNAGNNLQQLTFTSVQGAGETRIAAAAGVPPVIVGLSEGLQAATYSNYAQARRRFADGTLRPLWRSAAQALAAIVEVPDGAELWFDDRDIAFLREDRRDSAEIQARQAQTIRTLIDAGYDPDTVVPAVTAENFRLLRHSGLYSVQLRPPGVEQGTPTKSMPISKKDVPTVVEPNQIDPRDPS